MTLEILLGAFIGGLFGFIGAIIGTYYRSKWAYQREKQSLLDKRVLDKKINIYGKIIQYILNHRIISEIGKIYK